MDFEVGTVIEDFKQAQQNAHAQFSDWTPNRILSGVCVPNHFTKNFRNETESRQISEFSCFQCALWSDEYENQHFNSIKSTLAKNGFSFDALRADNNK